MARKKTLQGAKFEIKKQIVRHLIEKLRMYVDGGNLIIPEGISLVKVASDLTGIPVSSIYRLKNANPERYKDQRKFGKQGRKSKITQEMKNEISNTVVELWKEKQPAASDVMKKLQSKLPGQIGFTINTLRRVLRKLGFSYRKTTKDRSLLKNKPYIKSWALDYVLKKKEFEQRGRKGLYTDETWFNTADNDHYGWQHKQIKQTQVKVKHGQKGARFIVLHLMDENGFLKGCDVIFHDKDPLEDYHRSMNAELYENWIKFLVESNRIPSYSFLVMDNARYHNRLVKMKPNQSWIKSDIIAFIVKECDDIQLDIDTLKSRTKVQLLDLVRNSSFKSAYAVDEILSQHDIEVLRLPPYYCELNPIELAWGGLKRKVRKRNVIEQDVQTVKDLIYSALNEESDHCKGYVEHCRKLEDEVLVEIVNQELNEIDFPAYDDELVETSDESLEADDE